MPLVCVLYANVQNPQASSVMIQVYSDSVAVMFGRMGEDEMFELSRQMTSVILPFEKNPELKNKSMSWVTGDQALIDLRSYLGYRVGTVA